MNDRKPTMKDVLKRTVSDLNPKERELLKSRFGIGDGEPAPVNRDVTDEGKKLLESLLADDDAGNRQVGRASPTLSMLVTEFLDAFEPAKAVENKNEEE